MVRLIMGASGAGKTKQLIELVEKAVKEDTGCVVCIERAADMTYDISHDVRLVNASEYAINNYECLRGVICGLYAGNYDISTIFIDNMGKIAGKEPADIEKFLAWIDAFSEANGIRFTVVLSTDESEATEGMKKYM